MRIDKYLWCVRLFKTRTIAQDALRLGRVRMAGQHLKPSFELKVGDRFTVRHPPFDFTYLVLAFPKGRLSPALVAEYLTNETPLETLEALRTLRLSSPLTRDRGTGRPTKKERRDLDDFLDTFLDQDYLEEESEDSHF